MLYWPDAQQLPQTGSLPKLTANIKPDAPRGPRAAAGKCRHITAPAQRRNSLRSLLLTNHDDLHV